MKKKNMVRKKLVGFSFDAIKHGGRATDQYVGNHSIYTIQLKRRPSHEKADKKHLVKKMIKKKTRLASLIDVT